MIILNGAMDVCVGGRGCVWTYSFEALQFNYHPRAYHGNSLSTSYVFCDIHVSLIERARGNF